MSKHVISLLVCLFTLQPNSNGQKEVGDLDAGCPRGSYWHGGFCYSISTLSANFEDAELTCETGGGKLAMVENFQTHNFIDKLRLRKFFLNYWIGLNDRAKEGNWVFSDNTSLASWFKRWSPGEPNNNKGQQHCVKMQMSRNLLWDDDDCNRQWFYVCQFEGVNCTNRNGAKLGMYCFELSEELATFASAEEKCRTKGGYLVNIKSPTIYDFVKKLIYANRRWTSFDQNQIANIYRQHNNRMPAVWIGVRYFRGNWILSDDRITNYTQWAPNEPNNAKKEEDCVIMIQNWHDVTCDTIRNFACQYNVSIATTTTTTTTRASTTTTSILPTTTLPTTTTTKLSTTTMPTTKLSTTTMPTTKLSTTTMPTTKLSTTTMPTTEPLTIDEIPTKLSTIRQIIVSESPPIGSAFVAPSKGLNLSINHFSCLLFVFFLLGSICTVCFWGAIVYSRNLRRKFDSKHYDDQHLHIIEQDYNEKL